jgi:hypothetical protein
VAPPPPTDNRPRLAVIAFVALLVLAAAGGYATGKSGLGSTVPARGTPAVVPVPPAGRTLYLARLGDFPLDRAEDLVDYYRSKYGVEATLLPLARLDPAAWDKQRQQVVAEAAIWSIKTVHADVAGDPGAVIIGLISADLYIRKRPDWRWAFGFRGQGASDNRRLAVVSTARMAWPRGRAGDDITSVRLRKMVTRYIGLMYFGLPLSKDPRSVLYDDVGGVDDLDRMGEDF